MPVESPTRFVMVPARRSSEPTGRRRARRILLMLFLAASLSVIATAVSLAKGHAKTDLSGVNPKGRDLAYTAAVNFLAGNYQNVPHANSFKPDDAAQASDLLNSSVSAPTPLAYQSLNWVGFTPEHFGSAKAGFTDFEVHHFLVMLGTPVTATTTTPAAPKHGKTPRNSASPAASASSSASASPTASDSASASPSASPSPTPGASASSGPATNVVQLDVSVLITPQGPRLAAAPSFSVWNGSLGGPTGAGDYTNYSGLVVSDISDAVKNQVAMWAKAYADGDSAGLLTVTGDQTGNHHYYGLSGFTLPDNQAAVQILSAIKADKGQLIVRARVLLAKAQQGGTVPDGSTQFVTFADFDLLIGAPGGAQPPVLAWGPAGSAAELEPYSNAVTS